MVRRSPSRLGGHSGHSGRQSMHIFGARGMAIPPSRGEEPRDTPPTMQVAGRGVAGAGAQADDAAELRRDYVVNIPIHHKPSVLSVRFRVDLGGVNAFHFAACAGGELVQELAGVVGDH
ncbi:hypothetical protein ABIA30_003121 [Mycobacterium sp. MAA66]